MFIAYLIAALLSLLPFAAAAPVVAGSQPQWFTIEWNGPEFTAVTGTFTVPQISDDTSLVYVWPGLQGESGALQAEVSGGSGGLGLRNVFYGKTTSTGSTPSTPLSVAAGEQIRFSFSRVPNTSTWLTSLTSSAGRLNNKFSLSGSSMNRAVLAVQLVRGTHNFAVQFENLEITAAVTPAAEWCSTVASYGLETFTVDGAVADGLKCSIKTVALPATA